MKLLWALDVFEEHPASVESARRFFASIRGSSKLRVDVATVAFADDRLSKETLDPKRLVRDRLGASTVRQRWFGEVFVLEEDSISQRAGVLRLLRFAQTKKYDAVFVLKHARRGQHRSFFGSFAEMLCYLSPLPVFLVNPAGRVTKQVKRVLMPVDAGEPVGEEISALSRFVKLRSAELDFYHNSSDLGRFDPAATRRQSISKDASRIRRELRVAVAEAERIGARAKVDVIQRPFTSTGDAILRAAEKERSDLISLNHQGEGAFGFLFGRVTRKVLGGANCPVLLMRI